MSGIFSFVVYLVLALGIIFFIDKPIVEYKRENIIVVPSEVSLSVGCAQKVWLIFNGKDYFMNEISEISQKTIVLQIPKDRFNILETKSEDVEVSRIYSRYGYPNWIKWWVPQWITSKINFESDVVYEAYIPEYKILFIK
jgi:hypothetical protein